MSVEWEDEAKRAAIAGDWEEVVRHLVRAGLCRPIGDGELNDEFDKRLKDAIWRALLP